MKFVLAYHQHVQFTVHGISRFTEMKTAQGLIHSPTGGIAIGLFCVKFRYRGLIFLYYFLHLPRLNAAFLLRMQYNYATDFIDFCLGSSYLILPVVHRS